ncbi:MAG: hypothetical protein HY657_15340 [Acidobacteria bacterium]|nr:hypothetical protein [Acidobacteriota bacterium]
MTDPSRLDSWKEIARYLRRDIRTVIRWEQDRGLPVHRVPGGRLPRVFAYTQELDDWLAQRPAETGGDEPSTVRASQTGDLADLPGAQDGHTRRRRVFLAGAAGALLVIAGATTAWTLRGEADAPTDLAIVANELRALDATGRTRWTHRFDTTELGAPQTRWSHIGDVDADGRVDLLASLELRDRPSNRSAGELVRFATDGRLQWSATVDDRLSFRDQEYGPPWVGADLTVYRAAGEARIAWTVHHFTWWPSLLITLNGDGKRLGTYVNAGWIRAATPSIDGRHLFVTGVSNSRQAYFFAVLDAANPTGRSPEPPGSPMECLSCPPGDPLRYVVFPRTDISRARTFPGDGPAVVTFVDGTVQVHVLENAGPEIAATIYELSPDLRLHRARFSDSFWEWHRLLEAEGKLDHRAEDCPELRGLEVQHWTPDGSWQTIVVPVR